MGIRTGGSGMKVREKYKFGEYVVQIININEFREPSMKYLLDIYRNEEYLGESFVGEPFFEQDGVVKEEVE